MASPRKIVIALGGNALMSPEGRQSISEEMGKVSRVSAQIAKVAKRKGVQIAITHGNGTQAGDELIKNAISNVGAPRLPLGLITAETQASIGSMIELSLNTRHYPNQRKFATVITHVLVRKADRAFSSPTKPIGHSFTKKQLKVQALVKEYSLSKIGGRYRMVVPSPRPVSIFEIGTIKNIMANGNVICCGGGGIPITKAKGTYRLEDAVIDKDYTSSLLARLIGADMLIILTDIDYVYRDFPRNKEPIRRIKPNEIMKDIGSFDAGSMRPKIEACATFASSTGGIGVIGSLKNFDSIMKSKSGTIIAK